MRRLLSQCRLVLLLCLLASAEAVSSCSAAPLPACLPAAARCRLDRIDQATSALDGLYNPGNGLNGSGVHIYALDTGVRATHQDFVGRIGALAELRLVRVLRSEALRCCACACALAAALTPLPGWWVPCRREREHCQRGGACQRGEQQRVWA